ncbi:MAG TPA: hypothetical protein VHE10_02565 [Candidatus Paceibacterota bacterium]|nr:hypothetical protein [Candidatus Paceibacterota bacterium]
MGVVDGSVTRYVFTPEEIAEIGQRYGLELITPSVWKGTLNIYASYNGLPLKDKFEIKIGIPFNYPNSTPVMSEVGGRTATIIKKYKIKDPRDLHFNIGSETACLCVRQEEKKKFPPGSSLSVFIENLVIPYLYGLSHFDMYRKWPWGERSHGVLGMLEFYGENPDKQTEESMREITAALRPEKNWKEYDKQLRNPRPHGRCVCGKDKSFEKCHFAAFQGVVCFNEDLKRLGITTAKLFQSRP